MSEKKNLALLVAALLTLGLLVGAGLAGWAVAGAQTPPTTTAPAGPAVVTAPGKITATRNDGFTLETRQGTVEVAVSAQTWIVRGGPPAHPGSTGATEAALADLKVDMIVTVAGTSPAAGQIAARLVQEGPGPLGFGPPPAGDRPQRGAPPGAGPERGGLRGTIAAVQGATLTLTLEQNRTVEVRTTDATLVLKNGVAAVADLKAGDRVVVNPAMMQPGAAGPPVDRPGIPPGRGNPAAPGRPGGPQGPAPVIQAGLIWAAQDGEQLILGMVQAVDGNTLTLRSPNAEFKVQLGNSTTYRRIESPDKAAVTAAQGDVKAQTPVLILGTNVSQENKTMDAKAVILLPGPPAAPNAPQPQP